MHTEVLKKIIKTRRNGLEVQNLANHMESLVFIDERGVSTDETRHYGRSKGGERVN